MDPQSPTMEIRLFVSYSHADKSFRDAMRKALSLLKRDGLVTIWTDQEIIPGQLIPEEIWAEMKKAHIFAFLLSPDFIDSEFCNREWDYAKLLSQETDLRFRVPIIVRPCPWDDFRKKDDVKALPEDAVPISEFDNQDRGWLQVYEGIKRVIRKIETTVSPEEDFLRTITPADFGKGICAMAHPEEIEEEIAVERSGHSDDSAMARGKILFDAESLKHLAGQLVDWWSEALSNPKPQPNEDELWYLYHYLSKAQKLEFPLKVWKRERPDFLVESGGDMFGLEMTSVHSENYQKNVAEYAKYGMTDGPYFPPPKTLLVNLKDKRHRDNLAKGLSETGSALDRAVIGEITSAEIKTYVSQVALSLAKKVRRVAAYDFRSPVTIVVGIESTNQRRDVTWSPEGMRKESMAEIFGSLDLAARQEMELHSGVSGVCFLANQRLLVVPRNEGAYCSYQEHCLPVDQYLETVYSSASSFFL